VSELARIPEIVKSLAATDAALKRFGAAAHRYTLLPALTLEGLSQLEAQLRASAPSATLPADYRDYLSTVSAGGAGPYYGLLPAPRAAAHVLTPPAGVTAFEHALSLSHLGCGYLAVLALDGPASGQIWLDARELGLATQIAPTFTAFLADWVDRLSRNDYPAAFVPVGRCALQAALTGYLSLCEQQMGVPEGQLAGAQLRDALGGLGPGAIAIAAEGPLWGERETVDPCITCARTVENLAADGLDMTVVAPGLPPLPGR
jgi:hypothetical protein